MRQRLKSLELQGYKTFASKTRFEFPDQITAIVGPNGSGKSNIADAIRWVLGEQAYSLLRGKKTVDMIFTGSEHRSRASMASATINFDNEDGWLPIDYTEVSLTRRAYRSGENEYLLNNTRVRLKEINELLANSGLSERTYTIIGQGLVDVALSLKPEERRRFFEEAAGIELYRSRCDEATQKLDSTLRNMDRVRDILSELGPRLKSLEKQAERAREYDRIKADLFIYLRDWYGYQWNKIQEELIFARDFYDKQEFQLNSAREEQNTAVRKMDELRNRTVKIRTDLAAWHQENAQLHITEEKYRRELAVLDEREKALQDKEMDFNREFTLIEERISNRTRQVEDWRLEKEEKTEELVSAKAAFEALNQRMIERSNQRQVIETEINTIRTEIEKNETRLVQFRIQKDEITNRIDLFEKNISGFISSKEIDRLNLDKITGELEQKSKLQKQKKEIIAKAAQKIVEIERQIQGQNELIKISRDEISRLEARRLSNQAQLGVIENAEITLSGFTSGAKNLVSAAKSGRVKGNYVLLFSQIKTAIEYETAIASVLGDLLESLILEKGVDPNSILKFIEDSGNERTALIVPSWAKEADLPSKNQLDKDVISANEVVSINGNHQLAIKALLQNVFIARDRNVARKTIPFLSPGDKLVTLQGEVFQSNGLVIAGREARVKAISRTREKDDLNLAIKETAKSLELLHKKLADEENRLVKFKTDLDVERQNRDKNQSDFDHENEALQEISNEASQLKSRLDWVSGQEKELVEKIKQAHEEQQKLDNEGQKTKRQIEEINKNREQQYSLLKNLPLENLQEEIYFANAHKVVQEQANKSLVERIAEIEMEINAINLDKGKIEERIEENRKNLKEVSTSRISLDEKVIEVIHDLEALNQKIIPAELELTAQETSYQQLELEQGQSRQQFTVLERHSIQAQMKLNRVRDQQDNLRRHIEEDFGLVFYEYGQTVEGPTPLPIEGMVENLPKLAEIPATLEENIKQQKSILRRMGAINPEAQKEYKEVQDRHAFITEQLKDLEKAESDLRQVVKELDELMKIEFQKTFKKVNEEFREIFKKLFGGGTAELVIEDEENLTESGIDIEATLPGKRKQELASLSGGERSLTAVALIFALLKVSPTPFCILDEVDAMLDESNVMRFGELLRGLSDSTQFIVITHNRNTVQLANVLYGVTMGQDSTSQVISLKLDELTEEMVQ